MNVEISGRCSKLQKLDVESDCTEHKCATSIEEKCNEVVIKKEEADQLARQGIKRETCVETCNWGFKEEDSIEGNSSTSYELAVQGIKSEEYEEKFIGGFKVEDQFEEDSSKDELCVQEQQDIKEDCFDVGRSVGIISNSLDCIRDTNYESQTYTFPKSSFPCLSQKYPKRNDVNNGLETTSEIECITIEDDDDDLVETVEKRSEVNERDEKSQPLLFLLLTRDQKNNKPMNHLNIAPPPLTRKPQMVETNAITLKNTPDVDEIHQTDDTTGTQDTFRVYYVVKKMPNERGELEGVLVKLYACLKCSFTSVDVGIFEYHSKHAHAEKKRKYTYNRPPSDPIYKCKYCDYTNLFQVNIKYHIKLEHKKKSYKCKFCKFGTRSVEHLKTHIDKSHSTPDTFDGAFCNYVNDRIGLKLPEVANEGDE